MAQQYDNEMRGVLFKNDRREPGSKQPEYRGNVQIGGKKYWLSAWVKDGQKGKYFSLALSDADAQTKRSGDVQDQGGDEGFTEDDIPF